MEFATVIGLELGQRTTAMAENTAKEGEQLKTSPSPPPPQHSQPQPQPQSGQQTPPPVEAENTVEADTDDGASSQAEDTWDEGFDGSSAGNRSASTSLSGSVRDYVFENTRRYHKYMEGRYLLPNDEPEQEREDMKHAMCVNVMDGKLHSAPIENPQKVIDIGTGTGIWAIDSKSFPSTQPSSPSFPRCLHLPLRWHVVGWLSKLFPHFPVDLLPQE